MKKKEIEEMDYTIKAKDFNQVKQQIGNQIDPKKDNISIVEDEQEEIKKNKTVIGIAKKADILKLIKNNIKKVD